MAIMVKELLAMLENTNPVQGKKIKAFIEGCDEIYFERAESFFGKYARLLNYLGKDWEYLIKCYNKLNADMVYYRLDFLRTGQYSNKSFSDVQKRIYENPEIMEYHMHGLALAQFFWMDQYQRFSFFSDNLTRHNIAKYLEIGPGHGLYIAEAISKFGDACSYHAIDISPTSIEMTRQILKSADVQYLCDDIMRMDSDQNYDFITAGEVLEHLEDPKAFMLKIRSLLDDNGVFFMTTPANAPMIDHIHLFEGEKEIIDLIENCGFKIIRKSTAYAENMEAAKAIKYKVPLMFAAFLMKKST